VTKTEVNPPTFLGFLRQAVEVGLEAAPEGIDGAPRVGGPSRLAAAAQGVYGASLVDGWRRHGRAPQADQQAPERLLQHLVLLSADDREYLRREDGTIDADCVFCGTHYLFTPEELDSAQG